MPFIRDIQYFHLLGGFKVLLLFCTVFSITKYAASYVDPITRFNLFSTLEFFHLICLFAVLCISNKPHLSWLCIWYGKCQQLQWFLHLLFPLPLPFFTAVDTMHVCIFQITYIVFLFSQIKCYILKYLCSLKILFSVIPRREPQSQSLLLDIAIN